MIDPGGVERTGAADDPMDLITFLQQKVGKVTPVLTGDSGNQRFRHLVLYNRYGLPIAGRSLGEFQGAGEAPVSIAILAERAMRKFAQRTPVRRIEFKMARCLRCSSVAGRKGHTRSSHL